MPVQANDPHKKKPAPVPSGKQIVGSGPAMFVAISNLGARLAKLDKLMKEEIAVQQQTVEILDVLRTHFTRPEEQFLSITRQHTSVSTPTIPTNADIIASPPSTPGYDIISVYNTLHRRAPILYVRNLGSTLIGANTDLFVLVSHDGHYFSNEVVVGLGQTVPCYNVWELRVRGANGDDVIVPGSGTGTQFAVTEYPVTELGAGGGGSASQIQQVGFTPQTILQAAPILQSMPFPIVRNGGFEIGDLTFWTNNSTGNVTVQGVTTHVGNFALQVTGGELDITHKDLIPVKYTDMYYLFLWINQTGAILPAAFSVNIRFYDADGNLILTRQLINQLLSALPAGWNQMIFEILVPVAAVFMRMNIQTADSNPALVLYLDDISLMKIGNNERTQGEISLGSLILTIPGSGNTRDYDPTTGRGPVVLNGFNNYYGHIAVHSIVGTLTVWIERDDRHRTFGIGYPGWHTVHTFQQFTAVGHEVSAFEIPLGGILNISWIFTNSATFSVAVIGRP